MSLAINSFQIKFTQFLRNIAHLGSARISNTQNEAGGTPALPGDVQRSLREWVSHFEFILKIIANLVPWIKVVCELYENGDIEAYPGRDETLT